MKFHININQQQAVLNGWQVDFTDLVILETVKEFMLSGFSERYDMPEGVYYWVSHTKVMRELPLLGITTRQGVLKRMERLFEAGLLERHPDSQKLTKTLYRIGPNYAKLIFGEPVNESLQGCKPAFTAPVNKSLHNNNTNNQTTTLFNMPCAAKGPHTFTESRLANFQDWETIFVEELQTGVDLIYYYHAVRDWAAGKTGRAPKRKADWLLTVRNWMRRDRQAGKLVVMKESVGKW